MNPVMELSKPFLHRSIVGTPLGATGDAGFTGFFRLTGVGDGGDVVAAGLAPEELSESNKAVNENVGDELTRDGFAGCCTGGLVVEDTVDGLPNDVLELPSPNPSNDARDIVTPCFAFSTVSIAFFVSSSFAFCVSWIVGRGGEFASSFCNRADLPICSFISFTDISLKKYLLPEDVSTTVPLSGSPFRMGDVSNRWPCLKFTEPNT
jgi:hypothetical protein